jgi:hypothetical protein
VLLFGSAASLPSSAASLTVPCCVCLSSQQWRTPRAIAGPALTAAETTEVILCTITWCALAYSVMQCTTPWCAPAWWLHVRLLPRASRPHVALCASVQILLPHDWWPQPNGMVHVSPLSASLPFPELPGSSFMGDIGQFLGKTYVGRCRFRGVWQYAFAGLHR